ncbi:TPA: ATP-binding protein, partial [Escherichia coli]
MENNIIERLPIDTGVSATFLEEALTKDVTTLEAIFDLVDNSIDAARDWLIANKCNRGKDNLPLTYDGFYVCIRIDEDSIRVLDNCAGIDRETLTKRALYTNKPSQHEYGIGLYGIGLKRSLLKMGTDFSFYVDDGIEGFKSRFNNRGIGGGKEDPVYADVIPTKNRRKSLFNVSNLKNEIKNDLHNNRWFTNAVSEFSLRYAIYVRKGFKIVLHHVKNNVREPIKSVAPSLRTKCEFPPTQEVIKFDGVDVIIETGIHNEYTFPGEDNYSLANNRKLTDYFGIYFSCNDRVIVSASTEKSHGWKTKWHSEYNGYVCWVKFVSKDAALLPWNTAKTGLRTDSSLFLAVRDRLQPIADNYRSIIKQRYYNKKKDTPQNPVKGDNKGIPGGEGGDKVTNAGANTGPAAVRPIKPIKPVRPKARPVTDLPRNRDIFVDWGRNTVDVPKYRNKEYHIFVELCNLSSLDEPISCIVMLRVFLETTSKETMKCMNANWNKSLAKNTAFIAQYLNKNNFITDSVKLLVERYGRTDEETLLSINNIQSLVHSVDFNTDKTLVNRYWDDLEPFLSGCWRFIKEIDDKKNSMA